MDEEIILLAYKDKKIMKAKFFIYEWRQTEIRMVGMCLRGFENKKCEGMGREQ